MAAVEKLFISYNEIHQAIADCVEQKNVYEKFQPTMIIAIGSGGFIPGRMLRTFLKAKYDEASAKVRKTQWLHYDATDGTGVSLQGHNILIVDEVDDTRKTLHFAVEELAKDVAQQREQYCSTAASDAPEWQEPQLGIFVVHNKLKPKKGSLPPDLLAHRYFHCQDIPDKWCVYPWDALDIDAHQIKADERIAASKQ